MSKNISNLSNYDLKTPKKNLLKNYENDIKELELRKKDLEKKTLNSDDIYPDTINMKLIEISISQIQQKIQELRREK